MFKRKTKYTKALEVIIERLVKYDIRSSFGRIGNYTYSFTKMERDYGKKKTKK